MSFFNWVQSVLVGGNGNVANVTPSNALQVDISAGGAGTTKIQGDISGNIAEVDSSNQLKVVTPPPVPPSGTTAVTLLGDTPLDVGGNNNEYSYFTIPNGETLILQNIFISFEGNSAQSKVEIYDDPTAANPTGPNGGDNIPGSWNLILINHIEFNSISIPLNETETYLGDGTRRIALRRKRLDGGSRELYAKLSGYY